MSSRRAGGGNGGSAGRVPGVGDIRQRLLDFGDRADAQFVPVEELVLEPGERLVGLLARGVFVADPVDDRLEYAQPARRPIGLGLVPALEQRMDVIEEL